jgi:hypothetical protein
MYIKTDYVTSACELDYILPHIKVVKGPWWDSDTALRDRASGLKLMTLTARPWMLHVLCQGSNSQTFSHSPYWWYNKKIFQLTN